MAGVLFLRSCCMGVGLGVGVAISSESWNFRPMKSMRRAPSSMARRASLSRRDGLGGERGSIRSMACSAWRRRGGDVGAELVGLGEAGGAPGVEPEGVVADVDEVFGGHDLGLCLVDAAGGVAIEDLAEGAS